jgi:chromosome partitioning protein
MKRTGKTITLLAKKGGVGKSTLCILLYEAMRQAGHPAMIYDWDAQGTSSKALERFGDAGLKNAMVRIYDTPPNLDHTAAAIGVREADIVLVVTSPSPADIWEAKEAVKFAKAKNSKARIRVMFNKVRPYTILGRLVEESAKGLGAPMLPIMLSARECYQHAMADGWKALDSAAREEVLRLTLSLLSSKHGG